jgi:hypothetical protein
MVRMKENAAILVWAILERGGGNRYLMSGGIGAFLDSISASRTSFSAADRRQSVPASASEWMANPMDRTQSPNQPSRLERQISHLKIISRLLGHELHAQTSPRLTLSREEVIEIQTSLDLFIEDVMKNRSRGGAAPLTTSVADSGLEIQAVPSRVN